MCNLVDEVVRDAFEKFELERQSLRQASITSPERRLSTELQKLRFTKYNKDTAEFQEPFVKSNASLCHAERWSLPPNETDGLENMLTTISSVTSIAELLRPDEEPQSRPFLAKKTLSGGQDETKRAEEQRSVHIKDAQVNTIAPVPAVSRRVTEESEWSHSTHRYRHWHRYRGDRNETRQRQHHKTPICVRKQYERHIHGCDCEIGKTDDGEVNDQVALPGCGEDNSLPKTPDYQSGRNHNDRCKHDIIKRHEHKHVNRQSALDELSSITSTDDNSDMQHLTISLLQTLADTASMLRTQYQRQKDHSMTRKVRKLNRSSNARKPISDEDDFSFKDIINQYYIENRSQNANCTSSANEHKMRREIRKRPRHTLFRDICKTITKLHHRAKRAKSLKFPPNNCRMQHRSHSLRSGYQYLPLDDEYSEKSYRSDAEEGYTDNHSTPDAALRYSSCNTANHEVDTASMDPLPLGTFFHGHKSKRNRQSCSHSTRSSAFMYETSVGDNGKQLVDVDTCDAIDYTQMQESMKRSLAHSTHEVDHAKTNRAERVPSESSHGKNYQSPFRILNENGDTKGTGYCQSKSDCMSFKCSGFYTPVVLQQQSEQSITPVGYELMDDGFDSLTIEQDRGRASKSRVQDNCQNEKESSNSLPYNRKVKNHECCDSVMRLPTGESDSQSSKGRVSANERDFEIVESATCTLRSEIGQTRQNR